MKRTLDMGSIIGAILIAVSVIALIGGQPAQKAIMSFAFTVLGIVLIAGAVFMGGLLAYLHFIADENNPANDKTSKIIISVIGMVYLVAGILVFALT